VWRVGHADAQFAGDQKQRERDTDRDEVSACYVNPYEFDAVPPGLRHDEDHCGKAEQQKVGRKRPRCGCDLGVIPEGEKTPGSLVGVRQSLTPRGNERGYSDSAVYGAEDFAGPGDGWCLAA
jgi:hypothetical protein